MLKGSRGGEKEVEGMVGVGVMVGRAEGGGGGGWFQTVSVVCGAGGYVTQNV